jgi:hypothetical protein
VERYDGVHHGTYGCGISRYAKVQGVRSSTVDCTVEVWCAKVWDIFQDMVSVVQRGRECEQN